MASRVHGTEALVALGEYNIKKCMGKGDFTRVMLVSHTPEPEKFYVIKLISRDGGTAHSFVASYRAEQEALELSPHPFVVASLKSFCASDKVGFLLEYYPGGDLHSLRQREGRFSECRCAFFVQELVLAVEHLHFNGIIHRDLKPENVLLDGKGHSKIADFGLCKHGVKSNHSSWTLCGTLGFQAPEMINRRGYGKGVDWYALGALMHDLLTGFPPFYSASDAERLALIRSGILLRPSFVSAKVWALVSSLLSVDPDVRLGCTEGGGADVRSHEYFVGVDWSVVFAQGVEPHFRPFLSGPDDTRYIHGELPKEVVALKGLVSRREIGASVAFALLRSGVEWLGLDGCLDAL